MTLSRLVARPLLSSAFVASAVDALRHTDEHAAKASALIGKVVPAAQHRVPGAPIPTNPTTVVRVHAALQVAAALALAMGKAPRTSAAVLALSTIPVTLTQRAFWNETDPAERSAQRGEFVRDLSLLGGLMLASVDTDGRPGLAWRARRAAADVRREAEQLARETKRAL